MCGEQSFSVRDTQYNSSRLWRAAKTQTSGCSNSHALELYGGRKLIHFQGAPMPRSLNSLKTTSKRSVFTIALRKSWTEALSEFNGTCSWFIYMNRFTKCCAVRCPWAIWQIVNTDMTKNPIWKTASWGILGISELMMYFVVQIARRPVRFWNGRFLLLCHSGTRYQGSHAVLNSYRVD